eukprot:gene10351-7356_t
MVQDNRQRRHRANASSGNNDRHVSNAGAVDSASVEASTANDSSALITHQEEQTLPETQPLELPREAHGSDIDFDLLAADIPHIENFGPGMRCPVVVNSTDAGYEISNMVWGMIPTYFPADEKGNHFQLFNKRIEGLASGGEETAGKYFMQLMKTKRCVAVFDGFYEWKVIAGKKQPYYVHFSNNEPLLMAGIYEDSDYVDYHDMKPIHTRTFAILTGGSCAEFEIVHTRQPIFLTSKQAERWLDDSLSVTELDQLLEELRLAPTIADTDFNSWLKFYPVTKKLTDMKFQQSECTKEISLGRDVASFFMKQGDVKVEDSIPVLKNDLPVLPNSPHKFRLKPDVTAANETRLPSRKQSDVCSSISLLNSPPPPPRGTGGLHEGDGAVPEIDLTAEDSQLSTVGQKRGIDAILKEERQTRLLSTPMGRFLAPAVNSLPGSATASPSPKKRALHRLETHATPTKPITSFFQPKT